MGKQYTPHQTYIPPERRTLTPPITFAEVLTKITITPETPTSFLGEVSKYDLICDCVSSNKNWHPNFHMAAYQERMRQRKHNRELGV
jgi:hypothetical protein